MAERGCMCKGGVCRSQRVSDVHDEGTFMTQCGLWHKNGNEVGGDPKWRA